ncbi:MFS monocarboxylate transporter [Rhizoctonia solani 123E]|uniref:MFS monocarboxylate transporter n=1 Tax=Rhizoctonia solani 123E TaxID=1423351 RepID=A0A074RGZ0_9AGAM|nr:MFS monocarboxylate transporter [Rhizoctonia solani 123E]
MSTSRNIELGVLDGSKSRSEPRPAATRGSSGRSTLNDEPSRSDFVLGTNTSELPPVDTGFGAWSFVASAFALDTLIWGFGLTYGVFQEYFIRNKTFGNASEAALGAVGTTSLAIEYASLMFLILIPLMMWTCLCICCASLVCASFVTQVWQLILVQGVCFGIGAGGLYAPIIVYLSEWFSARKGLATAIIFGGMGAGGALYPLVINYLLAKLGFRWTLRIWAVFMFAASAASLFFIKPRLPATRPSGARNIGLLSLIKNQHWSFTYNPLFICMASTTFIQALAYFPVSLYMSVYTTSLGLPSVDGTIVLAVFNLATAVGQILFGYFCDLVPYHYIIIASGAGASLSAYLLWGFAHNLGVIFAFVVVFGTLSGGFSSVWPAASADIIGPDHQATVPSVIGVLGIPKGIAAVVGPIIAAALHHPHESAIRTAYSGYGFRDVTLFVGSMMLVTAAGGVSSNFLSQYSSKLHSKPQLAAIRNSSRLNTPVDEISRSDFLLSTNASELPPVDTGLGAWSFVASAFALDTLVWGFGLTYGVFQEYFIRNKTFGNASEAALGAVGTVSVAMEYASAMFVILAAQQWRHRIPLIMWTCLGICCISLVCASLVTQVWQLILAQGVCFGIGAGGLYAPIVVYLSEWFSVRKGLATAIIFGGTGVGGSLYPLAVNYLLENLGFRWTLRIWAAFTLVVSAVSLLFIKPRLPVSRPSGSRNIGLLSLVKNQRWSFIYSPLCICIASTTFIQALAYFPVSLYMSVYTTSLGLPPTNGTIVLAVFNLATVVGQILFGYFCDRAPYSYVIITSGVGASLSAYLLWGFAHNLGIIFAFVIAFGTLSGGFSSIWPAASAEIVGPDHQATVPSVFGDLGIAKGIAAVIGPIIAAALHSPHESADRTAYSGYGFRDVTLFVGSMMLVTAAGGVSSKVLSRR